MKSKLMATFMAGATLCAFTFLASATPAEAQACNNNNYNNANFNANRFRKFKKAKRRHLRKAVRTGTLPVNNYPYYGTQPVYSNPYYGTQPIYTPVNSVYGNVLNPYYNTGGIMNTLRNLF